MKKSKFKRAYDVKKSKYTPRFTQLQSVEVVEGERIETKVRRLMVNGDPIKDGAPEIFTERKDGVMSAYNIRTDRWEIATEAMDKVTKSVVAARENKGKVIPLKQEGDGEAEPTQGTSQP